MPYISFRNLFCTFAQLDVKIVCNLETNYLINFILYVYGFKSTKFQRHEQIQQFRYVTNAQLWCRKNNSLLIVDSSCFIRDNRKFRLNFILKKNWENRIHGNFLLFWFLIILLAPVYFLMFPSPYFIHWTPWDVRTTPLWMSCA